VLQRQRLLHLQLVSRHLGSNYKARQRVAGDETFLVLHPLLAVKVLSLVVIVAAALREILLSLSPNHIAAAVLVLPDIAQHSITVRGVSHHEEQRKQCLSALVVGGEIV
jgi:hypothetical protein